MKKAVLLCVFIFGVSGNAIAEDTRQYCEEMYPVDAYDASERAQYINECMAAYGETATTEEKDEYYEGTVEDFVESIPEEPAE